jgi:peptidoglycan hydrolase CwlO-like protein
MNDTEYSALKNDIENLQSTLDDILSKVDSIFNNVEPLINQIAESPIFKMLGGKKK